MRIWECPPRYCTHRRMASGARPSRPAGLAVEAHQSYATRNVDPLQAASSPPAHFGIFAVLLDVKCTRDGSRPAQPSSSRALDTRRLASAGPSPARTAPCAPCAARCAHHSPTEPEESQQRYKDPLPGSARPATTRHGAPAPCRVAAPRTAGLRGRATLPQLDWGRPARVRTSARTRWCPPGKGEHGVRTPRLCPVRPGHGQSGHSVPTGPLAFGTPLALSTGTPAHRHTGTPCTWTWTGTPERRFSSTNTTAAQGPRRRMRRSGG
jgi:hypothetical protein